MAGTFTHFIICDVAKTRRTSIRSSELYKLLNKHSQYLYLGAVSPDLPYLSFKTGNVNWADVMHYQRTNCTVISAYNELKAIWASKTEADEVTLIWLFGYISHLIADATIHPIIQEIVGLYEQHKEEHRLCEMTEDSLIFYRRKNADLTYAQFSQIIESCGDSPHFDQLLAFWKKQLSNNYRSLGEEPKPSLWFTTYTKAIDLAEGDSGAAGLFRHLGLGSSYLYKAKDDIQRNYTGDLEKYFEHVMLPHQCSGSFLSNGFDFAVSNIVKAWADLFSTLLSGTINVSHIVKNWNLDTGVDMDSGNNEVTFWPAVI
jgi:hypothetical protein